MRVPVRAHGEDRVARDGGADRSLVRSWVGGIEHVGSTHHEVSWRCSRTPARQRLTVGHEELDLDLELTEPARRGAGGSPLPNQHLADGAPGDALSYFLRRVGVRPRGGGEVFRLAGAGPYHRAGQHARQPADTRGGRRRSGLLQYTQAPPASVREGAGSGQWRCRSVLLAAKADEPDDARPGGCSPQITSGQGVTSKLR